MHSPGAQAGNQRDWALVVIAASLVLLVVLSTAPSASALTYSATGTSLNLVEAAQETFTGLQTANTTTFPIAIPTAPTNWQGYRLGSSVTFDNTYQFLSNTGFDTNTIWTGATQPIGNDAANMSAGYSAGNPGGTKTGVGYDNLIGKTAVRNATLNALLKNQNFTTAVGTGNWSLSIPNSGTSNNWNSSTIVRATNDTSTGSVRMYAWADVGVGAGRTKTCWAWYWINQTFTYDGLASPDLSWLSYSAWTPTFTTTGTGFTPVVLYEVLIRNSSQTFYPLNQTAITSSTYPFPNSQPSRNTAAPYSVSLLSKYLSKSGVSYTICIGVYVFVSLPLASTGRNSFKLELRWDNIGVYARYGKFNMGSTSWVRQSVTFGKSTLAANLTFWYWTNVTTIAPPTVDPYIAVWINGTGAPPNSYNYTVDIQTSPSRQWIKVNWVLTPSKITNLTTLTVRLGLTTGQGLLLLRNSRYSVLYDNVTLSVDYKPLPASVKLRIFDNQGKISPTLLSGSTLGQGSILLSPSSPWIPSPSFGFYANYTQVRVNYAITMYINRTNIQTTPSTLTFTNGLGSGNWSFSYLVPDSTTSGTPGTLGYSGYNLTVLVPTPWSLLSVTYGTPKTSLCSFAAKNSTWKYLLLPSTVFGVPNTNWGFTVYIVTSSNNRVFTPGSIITQVNATDGPNPTSWKTASYFYPSNYTRLLASLRNNTGGIAGERGTTASILLYDVTAGNVVKKWTRNVDSGGNVNVTIFWWSNNVTAQPRQYYFALNWTNGYFAACGYVNFTVAESKSPVVPTTLVATPANLIGKYSLPFNDTAKFYVIYSDGLTGIGLSGATVTWQWLGNGSQNSMGAGSGSGNYTAFIGNHEINAHYGSSRINVTASGLAGYQTKTTLVNVTVRPVNTILTVVQAFTPSPVPWRNVSSLQVMYLDTDHNIAITSNTLIDINSSIKSWMQWANLGNGIYQINLNSTFASAGTISYVISVMASRYHYVNSSLAALPIFSVRNRFTSGLFNTTNFVTPRGDAFAFKLTVQDLDLYGTGVKSANININWSSAWSWVDNHNGTYTIILSGTNVPIRTWVLNITVSLLHYRTLTILQDFMVRPIHTSVSSTPSGPVITVPWGDNVTLTISYQDTDHSSINILGATLTASGWSIGQWSYAPASGTYTLKLYTSTYVEGDVPVTIIVNETYYDQAQVSLTVRILPIQTILTSNLYSCQIFYAGNATYVLEFNDTSHGYRGISGAWFIIQNWPWSYSLRSPSNSPGTYILTLMTAHTYAPTGTYTLTIQMGENNYVLQQISLSLKINSAPTSVRGAPGETTVSWGDTVVIYLTYWDENHSIGVVDFRYATVNWTQPGPNGWYVLPLGNGTYVFVIQTKVVGEGNYSLSFDFTAQGYDEQQGVYWRIIVRRIATSLTPGQVDFVPWGDNATIYITYYDLNNSKGISGVTITINGTLWSPKGSPSTEGKYNLQYPSTDLPEGNYAVWVFFGKSHYWNQTVLVTFTIRSINTKTGTPTPLQVSKGNTIVIIVEYYDQDHNSVGISGANISVTMQGQELDPSYVRWADLGNGGYNVTLDTSWISNNLLPFSTNITISIKASHYTLASEVVPVTVVAPGFSTMTVIMMSGGTGGIVIFAILGYVMYRRSKIPFVIKKIDQSMKLISKGEMPEPVPMRARAEIVQAILVGKMAILSKEKMEELEKEAAKGQKVTEEPSAPEERVTREGQKAVEEAGEAETNETDVDMIAKELERLEGKGEEGPSEPAESAEKEQGERKESKRRKGDVADP